MTCPCSGTAEADELVTAIAGAGAASNIHFIHTDQSQN